LGLSEQFNSERDRLFVGLSQQTEADLPGLAHAPASSSYFTGRKVYLDKLEAYFSPRPAGGKSRRRYVLYGMGGAGKTQICLKFIEDYSHLYVVTFSLEFAFLIEF
jgi:hypothetical protein